MCERCFFKMPASQVVENDQNLDHISSLQISVPPFLSSWAKAPFVTHLPVTPLSLPQVYFSCWTRRFPVYISIDWEFCIYKKQFTLKCTFHQKKLKNEKQGRKKNTTTTDNKNNKTTRYCWTVKNNIGQNFHK